MRDITVGGKGDERTRRGERIAAGDEVTCTFGCEPGPNALTANIEELLGPRRVYVPFGMGDY